MNKERFASFAIGLCVAASFAPAWAAENGLSLEDAYARAVAQNSQIQVYAARIVAADGDLLQQSLRPNPEAVFDVENFAGSGQRNGMDAAEYTLGLAQKIETAGKRGKREKVADITRQQVRQEALAFTQEFLAETQADFMRLAVAQARLDLAEKKVTLSDKTHTAIKKRVAAAKSADAQHTRTDIEVETARMQQRRAIKDLSVAQATLAARLGVESLETVVVADLKKLPEMPEYEFVLQAAAQMPAGVFAQMDVRKQEAALDLARAEGVPDPVFGLGVRRFAGDDGNAFLASFSLPIPVYNRNQGAVMQAQAQVRMAAAAQESTRRSIQNEALALWKNLSAAREDVAAYREKILPAAQKVFAQTRDGFDAGRFGFVELMDTQRTLFDVEEKYLDALEDFYDLNARMGIVTGVYAAQSESALSSAVNKNEG